MNTDRYSEAELLEMARSVRRNAPDRNPPIPDTDKLRFGDLFCGLGVFSWAAVGTFRMQLVFAHEPDADARASYAKNFGLMPWARIPGNLGGENAVDILLGRVPENPDDFDQVIAPVVKALRPRGVMLGTSFAPLTELTPDGLDAPTNDLGLMWTYFRKKMRELGYRTSRMVYNSGVISPTDLYEHRLFAATLSNRQFPWRRVDIAVLPVPGSAEEAQQEETRAAMERETEGTEELVWDVTDIRVERYRAAYSAGEMGDWSAPVDSPDFAELLECALPFALAEAAVGIMAEFIGT